MKNVIITGAGEGIGYYLAEQLLSDGYNVTILDINIDKLKELKDNYSSLLTLVCDVKNKGEIEKCVKYSVEKFGAVDIAIHNACLCTFEPMENTDEETYKKVFDVNYFGGLSLAKSVIPYMKNQNKGKVIFTSSGVGVMGFINISAYASSKGAIESLAKCLNIEYKDSGITFHIFHPPLTRTKSSQPLPVPKEFMADPKIVGMGLAKNINKRQFIICHSLAQRIQTSFSYLMPLKLGKLMSNMTNKYEDGINK